MTDKKPDEKQFALKQIEQQMLQGYESSYFQALSGFLSFIALERLNYQVTSNTKFRVERDQLFISEALPPEPTPEIDVAGKPEAGK